jgi:4-hydroxybenzoate polyprenyltransferase
LGLDRWIGPTVYGAALQRQKYMPQKLFVSSIKMFGPIAWLTCAAAMQMAGALLLFGLAPDATLVGTYAVVSFSIYLLNRFTDVEDSYNCPSQADFFLRHRNIGIVVSVVLLIASLGVLIHTQQCTWWHLVWVVAGTLYSVRMIPWLVERRISRVRIKDVLFLKNLSVSLLWGITPFAVAGGQTAAVSPPLQDLLVVVLGFCLTTLMNTTSCDVRDLEGDQQAGVRTVATTLGKQGTGLLLLVFAVAGCVSVGVAMASGAVSAHAAQLFLFLVAWTAVVALPLYVRVFGIPKKFSEPLIDTQQVLCGAGLILLAMHR